MIKSTQSRISALILFITSVLLAACSDNVNPSAPNLKINLTDLQVVTYDSNFATLILKGNNQLLDQNPLTTLTFYTDETCTGESIGQGTQELYNTDGIRVIVSSTENTKVYAGTNTNSTCTLITTYEPVHPAPSAPGFTSFSPTSPASSTITPVITGSTSGVTASVKLFTDSSCTVEVGSGTATEFTTHGIRLTLTPNSTSTVYAKSFEPFGTSSTCTHLADFVHSNLGPNAPAFSSINPLSPNRSSATPTITGTTPLGVVSVSLYSDPACKNNIGNDTASNFSSSGITVTVPENSQTPIYSKSIDGNGKISWCGYLTTYIHDSLNPDTPSFLGASPASPTRITLYPKITGTASNDTVAVNFYKNGLCTLQIGSGTRAEFIGAGIPVSITENEVNPIYASSVDSAGNLSACKHLTDYVHDTRPPESPMFIETNPISPTNRSYRPYVIGSTSEDTASIALFDDEDCAHQVGFDTAAVFQTTGVRAQLPINSTSDLYAKAFDFSGNSTSCTYLTQFKNSVVIPPLPGFSYSNPVSPSNQTVNLAAKPYLVGTVNPVINAVAFFNDSTCQNAIGSGSAALFKSSGIQVSLPVNTESSIYVIGYDIYGNESSCGYFTSFIHTNVKPLNPSFVSFTPNSPTRLSSTPLVKGIANNNPSNILPTTKIKIYDSPFCINEIGMGSRDLFTGAGIPITANENAITEVYGKAFDDAGNFSACTFLKNFTHDALIPGRPTLGSITPNSPSFSNEVVIKGGISASLDFLNPTLVSLYSDPACTTYLTGAAVAVWSSIGIPLTVNSNSITTIYGQTTNQVGTISPCALLKNFRHYDLGPQNLTTQVNANGSVDLYWDPDLVSSPIPTYTLKRSTKSGGPYAIIGTNLSHASFKDYNTSNHETYYYVVQATNSTGKSLNSSEASASISVNTPPAPTQLIAIPGVRKITLAWVGNPEDLNYSVYRSSGRSGPYGLIKAGLKTSNYIDETVSNDVSYFYVVKSTNPAGESPFSNEAGAVARSAPPPPTNLTAVWDREICSGQPGVVLSWNSPTYFETHNLYFRDQYGNQFLVASLAGVNAFIDCQSWDSFKYSYLNAPDYALTYSMNSLWSGVPGDESNEATVHISNTTLTAYPGNNQIALSWYSQSAANDYIIKRALSSKGPYATIATVTSASQYVDTDVTNGTAYYYRVAPEFVSGGEPSVYSNEAYGIPGTNPSEPKNLTLTVANNRPVLSWTPPANYHAFRIYSALSANGPWTLKGTNSIAPISTSYMDTPGVGLYFYKVTALWGQSFESQASNIVSFRSGTPSSFAATVVNTTTPSLSYKVQLSWSSVSGASNYILKRATTSKGPYTVIESNATSPYFDVCAASGASNCVFNQGYFYVVQAAFSDGTLGLDSTFVSALPGSSTIPSGLTVTATTGSSVSLAWAKVSGATSYKVYFGKNNFGPYPNVINAYSPQATVSNLNSSTDYYFVVSAMKGPESAKSSQVTAFTIPSPPAPMTTPGNNEIQISWPFVTDATSYQLERSTDGINFATIQSGLTSTSYTDSSALNGQIYFYRIQVSYSSGTLYSAVSSGTTPGMTPDPPNGLSVTANSDGAQLQLSWVNVPGATSYRVYTFDSGIYTLYGNTGSNLNFTVSSLTEGTPITFAVTALIGTLESGYSSPLTTIPLTTPGAPSVKITGTDSAEVTWSAVNHVASYTLQRSIDSVNFEDTTTGLINPTYSDTGLVSGQGYFYRFIPIFSNGVAGPASQISALVAPVTAPLSPSSLAASANGTSSIDLVWIASPSAVSYQLFRSNQSGGPYTLLDTLLPSAFNYSDSSVSVGQNYFYILTAQNQSGVSSLPSNEAGVSLNASPSGLSTNVQNTFITLSWTPLAQASSYTLKRGLSGSGPFSPIYNGNLTNYEDHDVTHGVNYFYTVNASLPTSTSNSAITPDSSVVSAVAQSTLNLSIPIELTDRSMASGSMTTVFERSQTYIDPSAYDGIISTELEVIASNFDSNSRNISLVDSFGSVQGVLSVPGNTSAPKRLRASLSNLTSTDVYRIQLEGTPNLNDLQVYSVKLWIHQTGASKTKIYIPLLGMSGTPSNSDSGERIATTSQGNYIEIPEASLYTRHTSALSELDSTNPWELEAVVSASPGETGSLALINTSAGAPAEDSETEFDETVPTLTNISMAEGLNHFGPQNEGDQFEISIKCTDHCLSGVSIYKAGLWVQLKNLSKAEVFIRNTLGMSQIQSQMALDDSRVSFDPNAYSHPSLFYEATGSGDGGGGFSSSLMSAGSYDFGTQSLLTIPGSQIIFSDYMKTSQRSALIATPAVDERIITEVNPGGTTGNLVNGFIVVQTVK